MSKFSFFDAINHFKNNINKASFLEFARTVETAFTRKRKMQFFDYFIFLLGCQNCCIQSELDDYFNTVGGLSVSRQAFAKQREFIKPEAISYLSDSIINEFERVDTEIETYKGYRLFSVDGSLIDLPNTECLRQEFGCSSNATNKTYAKGLAMTAYDVLNKLTFFAELYRYDNSEKKLILPIIEKYSDKKAIWLLDRGYPSFALFSKFEDCNEKFLVRVSSQVLKEINSAYQDDQIVTITRNDRTLHLRVVNVKLSSGIVEKLVTNLPEEFTIEELKQLYSMRWGIEVSYRFAKQKLALEVFTGETKTAVLQDFYSAILVLNLAALAQREQEDTLQQENKSKNYDNVYHANKTKLLRQIKSDIVRLIIDDGFKDTFSEIFLYDSIKRYAYHDSTTKSFPRNMQKGHSHRAPHPKSAF